MPPLSEFITSTGAQTTDLKISEEFDKYLSTFPWIGTILDWTQVSGPWYRFDLSGSETSEQEISYLEQTVLHKYSKIWIIYSATEPGIVLDKERWYKHYDSFIEVFDNEIVFITGYRDASPIFHHCVERHFWEYIAGRR